MNKSQKKLFYFNTAASFVTPFVFAAAVFASFLLMPGSFLGQEEMFTELLVKCSAVVYAAVLFVFWTFWFYRVSDSGDLLIPGFIGLLFVMVPLLFLGAAVAIFAPDDQLFALFSSLIFGVGAYAVLVAVFLVAYWLGRKLRR